MIIKQKMGVILLLLILVISSSAQIMTRDNTSELRYGRNVTVEYDLKYIGVEPVYERITQRINECHTEIDGRSINVTICEDVYESKNVITRLEPKYERISRSSLIIDGKTINKTECYACNGYLLCLDYGFSEARAEKYKCGLRSGETGEYLPLP